MISGPGTKASGGADGIAGAYVLQTVNGQPLPYTYRTSGADTYVIMDATVTMTATGQWTEVWHERQTVAGVVTLKTFTDPGTFTITGTKITVTIVNGSSGSGTFDGTYASGTLTLPGQSTPGGPIETMVYTK